MAAPSFDFTGKVALVTGGGSGIGQAAAVAFAELGAKVVVTGRTNADQTLELIKKAGGEAIFVRGDVGVEADVRNYISATVAKFGRLDIAFNNAGMGSGPIRLIDQTLEDFEETVTTDLRGIFLCMKYEIPEMIKVGGGSIINNGSAACLVAEPAPAAYVAAKHGVAGLTKSAALEYIRDNVRINALATGLVETPFTAGMLADPEIRKWIVGFSPMNRPAQPEEIIGMVLFLASPMASFMTGSVYPIDGGQTAH